MEVKTLLYLPESNRFREAAWQGRVKGKRKIDTCNKDWHDQALQEKTAGERNRK